jgi:Tfp pilus assembly major pilin PilA
MFGFGIPELIILPCMFVPFIAWMVALVDIIRSDFTGNNKVIWLLIVLLVPLIGMILYFLIGKKQKIDKNLVAAMSTDGDKFCTACGKKIKARAEICPECGVRQLVVSGGGSNTLATIVIVIVVGFGFVAGIGILAAIAIPQFSAYRMKGYDSAALSDLKNAKTSVEAFIADKGKLPKTLEEAGMKPNLNIELSYEKSENDKGYVIISVHSKGDKMYLMTSESNEVRWKHKMDENNQFTPL